MAIIDAPTDIAARLRQGNFSNEQAIPQGVVLRVLEELCSISKTQVADLVVGATTTFVAGQGRFAPESFAAIHPMPDSGGNKLPLTISTPVSNIGNDLPAGASPFHKVITYIPIPSEPVWFPPRWDYAATPRHWTARGRGG